ncbi:hypothetical protein ACFX2I_014202 [Malus domestica]
MHKTKLFITLSNHLDSLHKSISEKSHSLESKIESLESHSCETLHSLDHREASIPEREFFVVARIEEQKAAALAEVENNVFGDLDLQMAVTSMSLQSQSCNCRSTTIESVWTRSQSPLKTWSSSSFDSSPDPPSETKFLDDNDEPEFRCDHVLSAYHADSGEKDVVIDVEKASLAM